MIWYSGTISNRSSAAHAITTRRETDHAPIFVCLSLTIASVAQAQQPGEPSVVNQGAANVTVNGHSAARQGDTTSNGSVIVAGSSNVMLNGKPLVASGDLASGYATNNQTRRLCTTAACTKDANKGCGSNGRDFSSG